MFVHVRVHMHAQGHPTLQHVKVYSRLQHLIKGTVAGWNTDNKQKPIAKAKQGAEAMMTKVAEIAKRINGGIFGPADNNKPVDAGASFEHSTYSVFER